MAGIPTSLTSKRACCLRLPLSYEPINVLRPPCNRPLCTLAGGEYTIRNALRKEGFKRYVARAKPLSERNKALCPQWAQEYLTWTKEQWILILWTDETWVIGGRHWKQCNSPDRGGVK